MKFSIITVSFNAGERLKKTLLSVAEQTCTDYEMIVKDGGSTDGSTDFLREGTGIADGSRIHFLEGRDAGIYDAMNRAVAQAKGEYVLFLNCGDVLADGNVLERTAAAIDEKGGAFAGKPAVFYGDTFSEKTGAVIASAPQITGFTCYRNIPCHQSCFYSAALCREKPYDLQYRIRADYDHFLWCFYRGGAEFIHLDFLVSSYEGGGYSESRENRRRDRQEHRLITETYMERAKLWRYRLIMAVTLAPLRRQMAESRVFSGAYHWVKETLYRGIYKVNS